MFNLCGYILITLNLYHQTLINFLKQQYHLIYTNHKLTSSLETGPLAPTEPGPRETQMNLVSREPGRGRCFACTGTGPGVFAGNQSSKSCMLGA
jgi:hypothetical protein